MPDEVVTAAEMFALHSSDCKTCSDASRELCPKGLRLLQQFHDALNAMLNNRRFDA